MRALRIVLFTLFLGTMLVSAQEQPQATSPEAAAKPSKVMVYVYRYKQFVGSALAPSVYCDEVQLARMDNGRYFTVAVDPGKHIFRSNDTQSGVELDTKAGQSYFIRVEIAAGMMKGHGRLILTAPEQGRYELQSKLKPLDAGKVMDQAHVSVEEPKFEAPAAATTQSPAPTHPATIQPVSAEHVVPGATLNDGGTTLSGEPSSLGDAARQARKKKAASDTDSPTAPPQ